MRIDRFLLTCLLVTTPVSAYSEDFRLNYLGKTPISLHTALSYRDSGGAHLVASATNESSEPINNAKICIVATGWQKECLFTLWNTAPWLPGAKMTWVVDSDRKVRGGLVHDASIIEFRAGQVTPETVPPAVPKPVDTPPVAPSPPYSVLPSNQKISKLPNLQVGTVLDSISVKTWVPTGSTTQAFAANTTGSYSGGFSANGSSATQLHSMIIQDNQLVVVTPDFIYVLNDTTVKSAGFDLYGSLGRAIANHKHGCHVIINDPVQFSPDKGFLNVVDVDGKICHMQIARQERILKAANVEK